MNLELQDRVALVAGGGRGIGKAVAAALAREGAQVAVVSRTESQARATAEGIEANGGRGVAIAADLSVDSEIDKAFAKVRDELGPPQILVLAAAAHYRVEKLHTVSTTTMDELLAVDVRAATALCRHALGDMMLAGYGRIVGLGSVAARAAVPGASLYGAGKAFLEGLMRGLAVDYSRRGITANVCSIGFVDTERLRSRIAGDADALAKLERGSSLRRLLRPEEIADVVAFLCSPRANAITGAVIDATGGAHLNNLW